MKLSAPIHKLKSQAKNLAKEKGIPLNEALNVIAVREGFKAWSLLSARLAVNDPSSKVLAQVSPGDLILIGARPGHGKTTLGLQLVLKSVLTGESGWFFSLEWNFTDILFRAKKIGIDLRPLGKRFQFDNSDEISAEYIIRRMGNCVRGTVVAIDYLQLLDQDRRKPNIETQICMINEYAKQEGITFFFISQIDRSYELLGKQFPCMEDVRLPNPFDLNLFDKACFISNGEASVTSIA